MEPHGGPGGTESGATEPRATQSGATQSGATQPGATEWGASEFAQTFAAAVAASGMSLDAIRRALADQGHQLSVATLSYWRSGRRRPERSSSLAALEDLEGVLGVEPGTLMAKLPGRSAPTTYDVAELYAVSYTHLDVYKRQVLAGVGVGGARDGHVSCLYAVWRHTYGRIWRASCCLLYTSRCV